MRKVFFILLSLLTAALVASEPLKIGVITDTHSLSEKLMDKAYAIQDYVYNGGKDVIVSPEVLDQVIADYLQSDIEILLVCGDLTKDGEKQSHLDFRDKLKPLYNKGVKIFVIPGNHDINMPNATRYQGNKTYKTDNINPKEFSEIYADYGFKQAKERDSHSLSYIAELDSSTCLLAIDAAKYDEYKNSPISSGRIKPQTEEWIKSVITTAKDSNKRIIAMMHWGITEHIPMQATVFKDYIVDDYKRVASLLADNGIQMIFTGHFHSNDITAFKSEAGNTIYDIETGALVSYPFAYRFIELSNKRVTIKTKNITSTPNNKNLAKENKETMKRLAVQRALSLLRSKQSILTDGYHQEYSEIVGELFVLHLFGDEIVSDSIKESIISIFKEKGFPVDDGLNNFEIDFPPLDNNITIELD